MTLVYSLSHLVAVHVLGDGDIVEEGIALDRIDAVLAEADGYRYRSACKARSLYIDGILYPAVILAVGVKLFGVDVSYLEAVKRVAADSGVYLNIGASLAVDGRSLVGCAVEVEVARLDPDGNGSRRARLERYGRGGLAIALGTRIIALAIVVQHEHGCLKGLCVLFVEVDVSVLILVSRHLFACRIEDVSVGVIAVFVSIGVGYILALVGGLVGIGCLVGVGEGQIVRQRAVVVNLIVVIVVEVVVGFKLFGKFGVGELVPAALARVDYARHGVGGVTRSAYRPVIGRAYEVGSVIVVVKFKISVLYELSVLLGTRVLVLFGAVARSRAGRGKGECARSSKYSCARK